jgi:hypothetical protein
MARGFVIKMLISTKMCNCAYCPNYFADSDTTVQIWQMHFGAETVVSIVQQQLPI